MELRLLEQKLDLHLFCQHLLKYFLLYLDPFNPAFLEHEKLYNSGTASIRANSKSLISFLVYSLPIVIYGGIMV